MPVRAASSTGVSVESAGQLTAAGLSVLAHLEDLVARGLVTTDGEPSITGRYCAAG